MKTSEQFFAAVDLHGDNGYYAVCDQHGRRIWGKRLPNSLPQVLQALEPYRDRLQKPIAIESTSGRVFVIEQNRVIEGNGSRLSGTAQS